MKKMFIGALVGAIIIFTWQFLSWGLLNLHHAQQEYTPKQDSVMAFLKTQFTEDGSYLMPNSAPGSSNEEMEKNMKANEGKPWVQLSYHTSMKGMDGMVMNMARGLLVNIVMVWILCWLFSKISLPSFGTILLGTLGVGIIVFFNAPYTQHIWYDSFDLMAHFADAIVSWGATGIWLGWWYSRRK